MFITNKVVLIGRLTKDIELKYIPNSGKAVTQITLAVDNPFKKDEQGNRQADFINIVVWGKQAENLANFMHKGSQIAVSGRIQTRNYQNKEGNKVYITEVVADEVQFLDSKKNNENNQQQTNNATPDDEIMANSNIPF